MEKLSRPSSEAKRDAIVAAARDVFFDVGYEAASIEAIAAIAGVSKVTIYNHFGGKPGLFGAAVKQECAAMADHVMVDEPCEKRPIRERLLELGETFRAFTSRPEILRFDRRMAAEADRDPTMGSAFLDAGPRPMCVHLAKMISDAVDAGDLDVEDPMLAAEQFVSMVKGFGEMERRYCGRSDPERDRDRVVGAVDVFLKAYGK